MSLVDQLNELWGGIVDSVAFDLVQQRAELVISVPEAGSVPRYQVAFSGISEFRFTDEQLYAGGWNYAELTEIHCDIQPDESLLTRIILWGEQHQLIVRSLGIEVQEIGTGSALDTPVT